MTVCIASDAFYPRIGGVAGFNRYLCENLLSQGHAVVRLTIDEAAGINDPDEITKEGLCTTVKLKGSYQQLKKYYAQYFRPGGYSVYGWIAMGKAMRNWLHKHHAAYHIDIVETGDWGGAGVFMADDELPPVVVTGHSSAYQLNRFNHMIDDAQSKVMKQLELLSYKHCAGIIAHSPLNQSDLLSITGKKAHFARAPWLFPESPSTPGNKQAYSHLVISGLQLAKGAATMAEAVDIITGNNSDWKIHWIGGDTYTAPGGKKVSEFLSVRHQGTWNKNFIWIPEKDHGEIMNAIMQASYCVIPSLWETFNYFALEAAFFEKPLIMTDTTGAVYLFENDPNVKIVPANDPVAMASLLGNESGLMQWKQSITPGTKQMLLDYFSPGKIVAERMSVYHSIIRDWKLPANTATGSLAFLEKYITARRKFYYSIRRKIKSIVKGK